MTDTSYDRAPGDISISAEAKARTLSDVGIYTIGFLVFWCVIACASGMTALLVVEQDDDPAH